MFLVYPFVWQSQFIAQFSIEKLESLLGSISQGLPSSTIIPWLQDDLVPFVSKVLPQGLVSLTVQIYKGLLCLLAAY